MSQRRRTSPKRSRPAGKAGRVEPVGLRIVGGRFRGSKLSYGGDQRVRPMKDRTREAVFNLLGPNIRGMLVFDLFAGTGAMALEALSRGASRAILIERHIPTARVIRENIAAVGASDVCRIVTADVFHWFDRSQVADTDPWLVFCCPPYDFYIERMEDLQRLIRDFVEAAPAQSAIVVESDERFDPGALPDAEEWDCRRYPPAVVSIYWKPQHGLPRVASS